MLYEFLTGMLPFKGQYFQVITQHAQVPPPPFSEICPALQLPPGVEAVVRHCLEKLPDRRPRSAREVFDEFRAAVGVAGPVGFSYPPIVPRPLGGTITQPATTQIDSFGLQAPEGSASQPSTHAFTDPGDGFKPAPPSGLEPDDDDDFDPVPEPEPEAEPAGKISRARVIASALIAVGVLVAIGLVVLLRSGEPKKDTTGGGGSSRGPISDVADTKKPVETVRPPEGWKSLMPAGAFAVVKGYGDDKPWPDRLRREKDQVEFNRLADGIYIPEGYAAEEPVQKAEDGWPKVIIRGLDQSRYVRLVGGKDWVMGNAWDAQEDGRGDTPPHPVRLSGFYIQETEVTNGQFEEYLKTSNSARPVSWEKEFRALKDLGLTPGEFPAVGMSWDAAQKYAQSCSGALPTEAQWEFAARSGGQRRRYVWGDTPTPSSDIAGIDQPSSNVSPPRRFPRDKTEQGAFDLAGNVREWCRDAWAPYVELKEPAVDPYRLPDSQSTLFVIRGASFADPTGMCSTTYRGEKRGKGEVADDLGFRIVIECPEAPQRSQP
jgi:serine/threonine-protein kinase